MDAHPDVTLRFGRIVKSWDAGIDRICRNAPHVIVAHAPKDQTAAPSSCTIALTYLELAAYAYGLGACWGGYFHADSRFWLPMQQALELPQGHKCFGAMMIGYPKYRYHRIPRRNSPKITWNIV
jgi:nitroreductase